MGSDTGRRRPSLAPAILLAATLAACVHPPASSPLAVPAAPVASPDAPLHGIELADLDRSRDPCQDFYEYANGGWRAKNRIPASMSRWSRRWAAGEANKERVKAILEELAQGPGPRGSVSQIAGDFYAGCMDERAVDLAGIAPIAPLLAEIERLTTPVDLERMIVRLHQLRIPVPFLLHAVNDMHDPTRVIASIAAAGLGLPDRRYYLDRAPRFAETRRHYRAHIRRLLELAGFNVAQANSATEAVLDLETRLAQATLDDETARDPHELDHPTSVAVLGELAPHLDWSAYLEGLGVPREDLNVEQPAFVVEVDRLLAGEPVGHWRDYLAFHLVRSAAPQLSAPLAMESFRFEGGYLQGIRGQEPRWKRCAEQEDELLGEAAGQKYVERYFPPAAKARVEDMVRNLLAAMKESLEELPWMGPDTKERALEKLASFGAKVGYPDRWKDYSALEIRRDAHWANVAAARRFLTEDECSTIGKPADRGRWQMTPPTSNAYYDPFQNEIVFPAGILQPPAFDMGATDAANYGGIGVIIGHEVSHGFDDQGSKRDAAGRLENWWKDGDRREFERRAECVVEQFEGYFIAPGIHHHGRMVLGEAIADQAGVKLAWMALQRSLAGKPAAPAIGGLTPEQQFFLAWGQLRGDAVRPELQRLTVESDVHPVAKYRVIGPLSNLPEFGRAFGCGPGSPMVRQGAARCEIF
ncbi:MAG TPA: M13 family metallopeptidase [Anaeromyxobacter sp.]|nr:M13 family metallopeptidase [Anaeromyxobacter sp.]